MAILTIPTYGLDVVGGRLDYVSTTQIQWTFLNSNQIRLFDGSNWTVVSCSAQPSALNTATDLSGTALIPNCIYDVFAEYSSPTNFTLSFSRWAYGGTGNNNAYTDFAYPTLAGITNNPGPFATTATTNNSLSYLAFDRALGGAGGGWYSSSPPSSGTPQSIMIDFGTGNSILINKYYIGCRDDTTYLHPSEWKLQGSNSSAAVVGDAINDNGWTDLDTRTGDSGGTRNSYGSVYYCSHLTNLKPYQKYRLRATNGGSYIGELKLIPDVKSTPGYSTRIAPWESTITYGIGSRVTQDGHDYVCVTSHTAGTFATDLSSGYWVDNGTSVSGDFAGLYRHDGVLVSDSSTTGKSRRWLGIIYTHNNGGTVNFKDDVNYRYISNFYNREVKQVSSYNTNNTSWTASGSVWRESNNGVTQYRGNFVVCKSFITNGRFRQRYVGLGSSYDVEFSMAINSLSNQGTISANGVTGDVTLYGETSPLSIVSGYNWITNLEYSTGTATIYSYNGGSMNAVLNLWI